MNRIDDGKKIRSIRPKTLVPAILLCMAVLFCGCGVSGGDSQITKMNEKYLAEQVSPEPGSGNDLSEAARQAQASTEPGDGKAEKKNGAAASAKNKAERAAEKEKPQKNAAKKAAANQPKSRKDPKNARDVRDSRKSSSDKKKTASPAPEKRQPGDSASQDKPEGDKNTVTCYISIDCINILSHMSELKESKREFVPGNGIILKKTKVTVRPGASAYDVLYQICRERKIHLEAAYTPMYKTYYIEGIHQLYEFDCGNLSGWNYTINGVQPGYGCSKYQVQEGDVIALRYTCSRGKDL